MENVHAWGSKATTIHNATLKYATTMKSALIVKFVGLNNVK
jgi:hypothetical protein